MFYAGYMSVQYIWYIGGIFLHWSDQNYSKLLWKMGLAKEISAHLIHTSIKALLL